MAMHPRLRYGLIIAGFVIFFALSPLFILFLSGQRLDLTSGQLSHTGVLSVTTKPSGATVTVNDENPKTTPVNIRFLLPDTYSVNITKPGYFAWHKRLDVRADRVTYAHTSGEALQLLPNSTPRLLVQGVDHYVVRNDIVYWTAGSDLNRTSTRSTDATITTSLPFSPSAIQSSPNGNWLLLSNSSTSAIFNTATNSITTPSLALRNGVMTDSGALVGLHTTSSNSQLVWLTGGAYPTVLAENVASFALRDQNIYYLQTTPNGAQLVLQILGSNNQASAPQVLSTLPEIALPSELYVTSSKTVFARNGSLLWLLGERPEQIAANVRRSALVSNDSIIYQTGLEWRVRSGVSSQDSLITRSGMEDMITLHSSLPYAFIWNAHGLVASELDNRDEPNRYELNDQPVDQVTISPDAETLYYLVNKQLYSRLLR